MSDFKLFIVRSKSTIEGTHGQITSSAGFACDALELPWNDNRKGVSCIMPDTYRAWLWYSPTLTRMVIRLEDKHGRGDCLLHNANFAGVGEGDYTEIHGCTAVGSGYGELQNRNGHMQNAILNSGNTLDKLIAHIKEHVPCDETFEVIYSWGEGCAPHLLHLGEI